MKRKTSLPLLTKAEEEIMQSLPAAPSKEHLSFAEPRVCDHHSFDGLTVTTL